MRLSEAHYAWRVLAACVVIELFGIGFGIFAITTVYPYIIDTFPDWSRRTVFLPTSLIILTVGLMSPLTGWIIDRYPIRWLFAAGIVVQGVALYWFSHVRTPFDYVASSLLLGLGMSGVTILPNQVLVSRWFHARVGLVNGIILAATALGAAMAPALITRVIEALGWRTAFALMAVLATAPPMLVVLLVVRSRPEELGLEPYGVVRGADGVVVAATGLALTAAVRLPAFWIFAAVIFLGGMPCYAYNKHILVFLKELGYAPVAAADYTSFFFLVSACARLAFGWLADRYDRRNLLVLQVLLIAGGYPLLFLVPVHPGLLLPSLLLFGTGYDGLLPSIPILAVHYFGRAHLGAVLAAYKIVYDVAAAGAPLFVAALYDAYGSYTVAQVWLTGSAWAAALLAVAVLPHAVSAASASRLQGPTARAAPG